MQNVGLDDSQVGIKISRRNNNNLRHEDDITLMAKSEEELKSLLKVKQETEKAGLNLNIKKNENHSIWSHHFIANKWGKGGNSDRSYFLVLENHCGW